MTIWNQSKCIGCKIYLIIYRVVQSEMNLEISAKRKCRLLLPNQWCYSYESGIALFAWRVTRNNVLYSPFKQKFIIS